ncbi:MAG: DivIVA domain-containing protein [Gemmatimonadota bacterium]|nr:DivIVA domain-containing protein [Gemmatimonadota bacterium]
MIDLTPLDVRKKRDDFKRSVRGYDPVQVDAFLELVSDRLEQLVREHGTLTDQVAHMQKQLDTYQERERALNDALLAAQELREEARSQSERDAAVRLREAETHAEAILLDADQAIRHSGRRLDDLRARRRQFLKSLRSVMERFEDYLELEETRLESEPEDLGDLLERLQNDLIPETADDVRAEPAVSPRAADAADVGQVVPSTGNVVDSSTDGPVRGPDDAPGSGGPSGARGTTPAPSANGHSEDTTQRVTDTTEEADSGSRITTHQPITPGDIGSPGASTN